jgi:hypothetical protein
MHEVFDNKKATEILLADGWHEIEGSSLEGVSYEFSPSPLDSVPHAGVRWYELDEGGEKFSMFAPLGQVLAISGGWPQPEPANEQQAIVGEMVGI